jgi:hypothetical protein
MPMETRRKQERADHSGSSFDSFLEEEEIREEVEAVAIKRLIRWQVESGESQAISDECSERASEK